MAAVAPIISGTPPLSALNALQGLSRSSVVAVGVVCLHILLFWTLQSGLLRRTPEVIVPVQMTSEFVPPPAANLTPSTFPPAHTKLQTAKPKSMATVAPPQPFAIADPTPAPSAPVGVTAPRPELPPAAQTASIAAAEPLASLAPARAALPILELPSSDADYLQNPPPVYPAMSKRLNEQGQVIHSVMIGVDGLPISARLLRSSGFDRLDQAAYKAVMSWRYTPGKRSGVETAMAYNAPINWVLE